MDQWGLDGYRGCRLCKIPEFTNESWELVGASLQTTKASVCSFSDILAGTIRKNYDMKEDSPS